jgi:hypothetical protein
MKQSPNNLEAPYYPQLSWIAKKKLNSVAVSKSAFTRDRGRGEGGFSRGMLERRMGYYRFLSVP